MKAQKITLVTEREGFINITSQVQQIVAKSGVKSGLCTVFCPHTTAGITINENADPNVVRDMLFALGETHPNRPQFRHMEGNSAAHLKSSAVGCEKTLIIEEGELLLGRWQGIYFCEFDGPRTRNCYMKIIGK